MATQWTAGLSALTPLPAATLNRIGAEFETWTPNFVPETGAWTTVTLNFARYGRLQKFVFGEVLFAINNFGTGNGAVTFTLPVPARVGNPNALGVGREAALTGQTFNVWRTGASTAAIRFYANASTANGNYTYPFNFFYEAA